MKRFLIVIAAISLVLALASCGVNNEVEPNNTMAQATNTNDMNLGGTISTPNDVDYFSLNGQEGTRARFVITHAEDADFDFEVYSNNRRVGSAIGMSSGDEVTVNIPGRCHVRVWRGSGTSTGSYQISISQQ